MDLSCDLVFLSITRKICRCELLDLGRADSCSSDGLIGLDFASIDSEGETGGAAVGRHILLEYCDKALRVRVTTIEICLEYSSNVIDYRLH